MRALLVVLALTYACSSVVLASPETTPAESEGWNGDEPPAMEPAADETVDEAKEAAEEAAKPVQEAADEAVDPVVDEPESVLTGAECLADSTGRRADGAGARLGLTGPPSAQSETAEADQADDARSVSGVEERFCKPTYKRKAFVFHYEHEGGRPAPPEAPFEPYAWSKEPVDLFAEVRMVDPPFIEPPAQVVQEAPPAELPIEAAEPFTLDDSKPSTLAPPTRMVTSAQPPVAAKAAPTIGAIGVAVLGMCLVAFRRWPAGRLQPASDEYLKAHDN